MVPVVLSILLVVLISGAVLWVVAGEVDQPTSVKGSPAEPAAVAEIAPDPQIPVAPASVVTTSPPETSRRPQNDLPPPRSVEVPRAAPMVATSAPRAAARIAQAPHPRHRVRSSVLLLLLIAVVGVLLAVLIGAVLAALALVLRAAVTS